MANRSYLYALSNRPSTYHDRPERVTGLSEWPYDVPFLFRLLASGNPEVCASLISEGLEDEDADGNLTTRGPLHAISGDFAIGFARVQRFLAAARIIASASAAPTPATAAEAEPRPGLVARIARALSGGAAPEAGAPEPSPTAAAEHFLRWLDDAERFLAEHRDQYVLLETVEVDIMTFDDIDRLAAVVHEEADRCRAVGAAVDALPADPQQAAAVLARAAQEGERDVLAPFEGLRFDDECDLSRGGEAKPLGVSHWSTVLYFDLWTKAEYDAAQGEQDGTVEG